MSGRAPSGGKSCFQPLKQEKGSKRNDVRETCPMKGVSDEVSEGGCRCSGYNGAGDIGALEEGCDLRRDDS